MPSGRALVVTGVVATVALTGCYGSTEPATDVGPETARLNARGTANNGPARSWFQYWLTGTDRHRKGTSATTWPAGASGPFSERVTGLAAGSSYSFRVCGSDEGAEAVCAQTRTFTTRPPVEDALMGYYYAGCCSRLDIDAHSGPQGGDARGQLRYHRGSSSTPTSEDFTGSITCLAANGTKAAAGAVGTWRPTRPGSGTTRPGTILQTVVDGRAQDDMIASIVEGDGSTPPNCAAGLSASTGTLIIPDHELIVNDAP